MQFTHEVEQMCCVAKGPKNPPAPIPQEGGWTHVKEINQISGLTHGVGWCAPQQGACKLTLNVKDAMAAEILPGKTILEALNTDLVCDAINTAMRELFLQIVYGRTQTAFSEGGLPIGAGLEDLKQLRSITGTMYGTSAKGVRYLEMAEGYVTGLALDEENKVIGYEFVNLGKMMEAVNSGKEDVLNMPVKDFVKKFQKTYGRFADAVKVINPRKA